jgi:hypothetical protein
MPSDFLPQRAAWLNHHSGRRGRTRSAEPRVLLAASTLATIALALAVASPAQAGCNSGNTPQSTLLSNVDCQADASGSDSTAVGAAASATASFGAAFGDSAVANGLNATSLGGAAGPRTAVEGATSVGTRAGQNAAGLYSTAVGAGPGTNTAARAEGAYSVAIGGGDGSAFTPSTGPAINLNGARALGFIGTAVGVATEASGGGSSAFGLGSKSTADDSSAYGEFSTASGPSSTALGVFSTAVGSGSVAIGVLANANGTGGTAVGQQSNAGGTHNNTGNTAIGTGASAGIFTGDKNDTAVGLNAVARESNSSAFGVGAQATKNGAVALGSGAIANLPNTVSVGSSSLRRRIVNVADGVNANDAVNFGQLQAALLALAKAQGVTPAPSSAGVVATAYLPQRRAVVRDSRAGAAPAGAGGSDRQRTASLSAAATGEDAIEPSIIVGWANVGHDGTLAAARNVAGHSRHGVGEYEIAFRQASLKGCTFNATLNGPGFAAVNPAGPNRVSVQTRNHYGVLTDAAFYLMAVC